MSGIPDWTRDSWEKPELQGVMIEIAETGKAVSIERILYSLPNAPLNVESPESAESDKNEQSD